MSTRREEREPEDMLNSEPAVAQWNSQTGENSGFAFEGGPSSTLAEARPSRSPLVSPRTISGQQDQEYLNPQAVLNEAEAEWNLRVARAQVEIDTLKAEKKCYQDEWLIEKRKNEKLATNSIGHKDYRTRFLEADAEVERLRHVESDLRDALAAERMKNDDVNASNDARDIEFYRRQDRIEADLAISTLQIVIQDRDIEIYELREALKEARRQRSRDDRFCDNLEHFPSLLEKANEEVQRLRQKLEREIGINTTARNIPVTMNDVHGPSWQAGFDQLIPAYQTLRAQTAALYQVLHAHNRNIGPIHDYLGDDATRWRLDEQEKIWHQQQQQGDVIDPDVPVPTIEGYVERTTLETPSPLPWVPNDSTPSYENVSHDSSCNWIPFRTPSDKTVDYMNNVKGLVRREIHEYMRNFRECHCGKTGVEPTGAQDFEQPAVVLSTQIRTHAGSNQNKTNALEQKVMAYGPDGQPVLKKDLRERTAKVLEEAVKQGRRPHNIRHISSDEVRMRVQGGAKRPREEDESEKPRGRSIRPRLLNFDR